MGVAPSKIEDNKALVLCQKRKRLVREASDGRCAFTYAHNEYIQSLANIGPLLRKCFEPGDSIPNLSPSRMHINHMKVGRNSVTTIEENLSVPVIITIRPSSPAAASARGIISDLEDDASFETPTGSPLWEYSSSIHSVDNQVLVQDKNTLGQDFNTVNDVRRLREKGGILELEEEGEKTPANEGNFGNSGSDFDSPSTEYLAKISNNHNDVSLDSPASNKVVTENIALPNTNPQSNGPKNEKGVINISTHEFDENPMMVNAVSSAVALPMGPKEPCPDVSIVVEDLYSCMNEIEILFLRAGDSGKEVSKILGEDIIQFRPLLPKEKTHGSRASSFFATLTACCREAVAVPETPPQAEIKYLTWHRSMSSQLSPFRNPPGPIAGIHTSTLDRLHAWERKLYDEVKASSAICRRYDEKCRQLRGQESRGKNQINIDFTRANVKDLHARILVAIQRTDFISKNIEDLRDKELQPQLDELIESFTRMWETMLECYRRQHAIIKLVSSSCSVKISLQSESQCQTALLLSIELSKLCSNFQNWIASLKAYLCTLNLWLHKCMKPLKKRKISRKQNILVDVSLTECAVAPIFTTCEVWMKLLDDLPTKDLEEVIGRLIADINRFTPHQDEVLNGEMRGEIRGYDAPANLQSSIMAFLEKHEAFSERSLQKYIDLKKSINAAKERFLGGA